MDLKRDKRQNIQKELDFSSEQTGEARQAGREETESRQAMHEPESPANTIRLMEEVCERENLLEALRRVKGNKGSAGIDGMTVGQLSGYLKEHWLTIREQLLNGTYKPQPVRRVEIEKPDGGGMRKLGIPTTLDRFLQQAVMQVLQRRWDRTFSDHSYGFRPGRSAHQAVTQAQLYLAEGYGWVIDLDLEKFFDRVNHDKLMGQVAKRVDDKRLLKLIRAFLNAGVMENGLVSPSVEGTPQGGPITPRTQKAISSLKEQLRGGEKGTHCLISVVNSNTVMSNDPFDKDGEGSPAECRSRPVATSNRASRSSASVVARVRLVRAPSISLPARSFPTRSTDRSSRSHCANYLEASAANRGAAAQIREKQWSDHWSDCSQRIKCISARSKKAWLNRVKIAAHFKLKSLICLIAYSSRNSRRLTSCWCHVASTPSG
ncbi:MAG TPA: reverse transcriptase domain-containing protein [Candidatus Acidoferrum sp.]|nr:reverse transcriptase domain-containing protein [Candidatus Acidoferrum sp.]